MTFGYEHVGFIRKWPALPRVVIFLTVRMLPAARIPMDDRYTVTKIPNVEGFYDVTYYKGFKDEFDVRVDGMIDRISTIEARSNPRDAIQIVKQIRQVARRSTHVVPHYVVISKKVGLGGAYTVINWVRAVLVEEIYGRLATMFPDNVNWLGRAQGTIHVGVNAVI